MGLARPTISAKKVIFRCSVIKKLIRWTNVDGILLCEKNLKYKKYIKTKISPELHESVTNEYFNFEITGKIYPFQHHKIDKEMITIIIFKIHREETLTV